MRLQRTLGLVGIFLGLCTHGIALAELPPIRLGVIGPVTGKATEDSGMSIMGGAKVFAEDINRSGGILGRKVEIVERDDKATPELGVALVKELIEKEKVAAIVGFGNTGVVLQVDKVVQDAKIPMIVTAAAGVAAVKSTMPPAYPASYVFRTGTTDGLQTFVLLNELVDRRRLDKIALIHDESPYGTLAKQNVLTEIQRHNLKLVDVESFKVGDPDVSAQLQRIKDSGAQVVIMYCLAPDAAMVAKNSTKLKLKLPLIGPWLLSQQSFIDKAGASAEGVHMTVTFIENEMNTASNAFSLSYRKINKVSFIPSPAAAAQTYDALRLLASAIAQANSDEGPKIQQALEDLKWPTTTTVVAQYSKPFSPTNHEAITQDMVYMGEIRDGKVVFMYKDDAKRATTRVKKGQ
ncbi:MAG TPA: ABC transporter substrate-binding protein [Burkholderiaceae bacterium]|jgi:branched-chain amino acid transport system substrate-binding protein